MSFSISLDISGAYLLLSFLERKEETLVEKILNNRGIRYILFHHGISSNDFTRVLKSIIEGKEVNGSYVLRHLYDEYRRCCRLIDEYRKFMLHIVSEWDSITNSVITRVKDYLPDWCSAYVRVYLVLGGDDAYGVNLVDTNAIIINVSYFLNNLDAFIAILAHEVHHKCFWKNSIVYNRLGKYGERIRNVYEILGEIVGEGVASVVSKPYGPYAKYLQVKENIKSFYEKVEEGVLALYEGKYSFDDLFVELYCNMGPIYMVGVDMTLKIISSKGLASLKRILDDVSYRSFFVVYNEISKEYKFSSKFMRIVDEVASLVKRVI